MKTAPAMKPTGGEMTRLATCLPSALHLTPPRARAAPMPAPQRPPMSACVELLGKPRYQVMRFQQMAPRRAAMITTSPALKSRVLAIVFETLAWKNATVTTAPTRLKVADSSTAAWGEIARVETDVAMALAVSWKPLVKSKPTAMAIVTHSRTAVSLTRRSARRSEEPGSGVLDRERLDHFGAVLAFVHRLLEQRVHVLPLDQVGGSAMIVEQVLQR